MLVEEFLVPMEISQRELADSIRVPYRRIHDLARGRRGITPSTALRLGRFLGTSADFWMNLQMRWDLFQAKKAEQNDLARIQPRARARVR
jgi:addiction module HigA family antidote